MTQQPHTGQPLHLRSQNLSAADIPEVIRAIHASGGIHSLSLSYNPGIGDVGTIALMEKLPQSITELGMVGCAIGDAGGEAILDWVKKTPGLRMACIEENHFTERLKADFLKMARGRTGLMLVI